MNYAKKGQLFLRTPIEREKMTGESEKETKNNKNKNDKIANGAE